MVSSHSQKNQNSLPKNLARGKYFSKVGHCTRNISENGYNSLAVKVGRLTLAMDSKNISFAPHILANKQKNTTTPAPVVITTSGLSANAIYADRNRPIIQDSGLCLTILGIERTLEVFLSSSAILPEKVKKKWSCFSYAGANCFACTK